MALVPKLAVIGHVEHVTLGRVAEVPRAGDIAHLAEPRTLAGGGGGLAFAQLVRSDAEVHFFTALGDDDGAREVRARLPSRPGVFVHAAERRAPHPRVVVMVDDGGRRTIVVTAEPLQPAASDPLPWAILADCDAAYFTGRDPASLVRARAAKTLLATARRREVIAGAGVRCDVVVGSVNEATASQRRSRISWRAACTSRRRCASQGRSGRPCSAATIRWRRKRRSGPEDLAPGRVGGAPRPPAAGWLAAPRRAGPWSVTSRRRPQRDSNPC